MSKTLSRRDVLRGIAVLPLLGLVKLSRATAKSIPKHDCSVTMIMKNGDTQVIYFNGHTQMWNKMGHYSCYMTTTYELENIFELGKIGTYKDPMNKPHMIYRGFDKHGNLVYDGVATEKIWRTKV